MANIWRTNRKNKGRFKPELKTAVRGASKVENKARRGLLKIKKRTRNLTREQRAKLRTLENPLLFKKLVDRLLKFNPNFDVQLIDTTLEYDEALNDLSKKIRNLVTRDVDTSKMNMQELRNFLSDKYGIDDVRAQNLIIMDKKPLPEEELGRISYMMTARSLHSKVTDRALEAPLVKTARQLQHLDRYDLPGFDTKGTKTDITEKI